MFKSVSTTRDTINAAALAFSRAAGTVDPLGAACAAGVPRYDRPMALVAPPADSAGTLIVDRGTGTAGARIMGYDNATMIITSRENGAANPRIQIFTGAPGDEENAVEGVDLTTINLQASSNFGPVNDHDGDGDASLAYVVAAGSQPGYGNGGVRDNLMVVCGPVVEDIDTTPSNANGRFWIGYSVDRGATWSILHDETDATFGDQRGVLNGANLVTGPFIATDEHGDEHCFFCMTDYKNGGGSDTTGGGELWLVGAKRQGDGRWGTPAKLVVIDRSEGGALGHLHSGGCCFRSVNGVMRMVVFGFRGDTLLRNSIESRWVALADWNTDTGGSTITEAGAANTNWSAVFDTYGACAASAVAGGLDATQWVGVAPGAGCASLLIGSDEVQSNTIASLHADDYDFSDGSIGRIRRVFGWGTTRVSDTNVFTIAPDPDLNGGFVARIDDRSAGDEDDPLSIYSPDGVHCGLGHIANAAVRRGYVYRDGVDEGRVRRFPRPAVVTGRPLMLGRGGSNLVRADAMDNPVAPGPLGGTATAMTDLSGAEAAALPAKPFDSGVVIQKHQYGPNDAISRVGTFEASASLAAANMVMTVATTAIGPWRHRNQLGIRSNGANLVAPAKIDLAALDTYGEWRKDFLYGATSATATVNLIIFPSATGGLAVTDLKAHHAYAIPDLRNDGLFPGYPIAPGATAQPNEAIAPSLPLGSQWTLYLAFTVPTENWDRSVQFLTDQATNGDGIEIARIVGDADNYIRIGLRCGSPSGTDLTNDEIVINGETGGAAFTRMSLTEATAGDFKAVRGSQILVGLSYDGTTLRAAGYWNQHKATADSETVTQWATQLTTLRECQASSYWSIDFWGYSWSEDALSASAMESELVSLPFTTNVGGGGRTRPTRLDRLR